MSQRTTLGIAAAVTAFVLVLLGGLASQLSQANDLTPTAAATGALAPPAAAAPILDPPVAALIQEREAAYQTALAEANRRLEEANRQIAAANARLAEAAAPGGAVSAEQAAQVAVSYRGGGTVREVEQEDERGALVYEVKFTDGGKVYVDAATGQVVYARVGDGDEGEHGGNEHAADQHDD